MKASHEVETQKTDGRQETTREDNALVRPTSPAGRPVSFEEALEITLKEDKELLRRLAQ